MAEALAALRDDMLGMLPKLERNGHMVKNSDGTSTSYSHDYDFGHNAACAELRTAINEYFTEATE
jgi:hypothetical protein